MERKYEFTDETKEVYGRTLHRIRAVRDFGDVKSGNLGGWIEKEENLSHQSSAWIYGNAQVRDNARICGNAKVYDNVLVYNNAQVFGNAWVFNNAQICGNAWVYGNAWIHNNAQVFGNAHVYSNAQISSNAVISKTEHVLVIGSIGSRKDFTTFYRDKDNEITVICGCFKGKIDDFLEMVSEKHGENKHAQVYRKAAELAKLQIDLTEDEENAE